MGHKLNNIMLGYWCLVTSVYRVYTFIAISSKNKICALICLVVILLSTPEQLIAIDRTGSFYIWHQAYIWSRKRVCLRLISVYNFTDPGVKACCHGRPRSWEYQRAQQIRTNPLQCLSPANSHRIDSGFQMHLDQLIMYWIRWLTH